MTTSRRNFIKSSAGIALIIGATGGLTQLVSCKNAEEAARQAAEAEAARIAAEEEAARQAAEAEAARIAAEKEAEV